MRSTEQSVGIILRHNHISKGISQIPRVVSIGAQSFDELREEDCFYVDKTYLVDKAEDYIVKSNRESGYGRYDVVMEPKNREDVAVIMVFKVQNEVAGEDSLDAAADGALL